MNTERQELDAPTKLVGFVVGIAFLFLAALFVGDKIGPDVPPPVASHTDHDSHDAAAAPTAGTYAPYLDFQHGGVVHTAEFTIEAQEGQS
ncbi:hypothetical protein [Rhodococcus sp. NPDC076796]|uniref:hypothetical protein n=1 Tax=Rhodococcus sp. NPDC076796 TaxID=3154859 RepID=UPI003450D8B0